ncbi:MAG: 50S ribosomal protein L7/L12 [Anaerolineales bacterium]|jgi:large subunit ribosomal protein L7/L12|uniref:50S ribosomal protein L7/L12 n=1 Tax=Candidatus Villigracilis vicinus TaxID=3140679 RepID=UPI00313623B5|nr:50S ribosomal protein L7/L12 [Anaerolineales bacterium]MBK9780574.1 50S ribosomal protein L7/L12 [Anaerolineales bacterium]
MSDKLAKLVDELSTLSVLEAADLVKMLEEKWGVSAAAPVAVAAAGPAAAAEPVEEKTEFDVVIKDAGAKKIDVIKVIRQLTSLGLGEAKALAEAAGSKVLTGVGKDAAMDAKKKLEEAGAAVVVE